LQEHLSSWDALRSALPVGTVSGAPKVRDKNIDLVGARSDKHCLMGWMVDAGEGDGVD